MAFPLTAVLDNFNRADGGLGANWTSTSTTFGDGFAIAILSNQAAPGGNASGAAWNGALGPNCEVYLTVPVLPLAGNGIYVDLRYSSVLSTCNGYQLQVVASTSTWAIRKVTSGSGSTLGATFTQAVSAGDSVGFSAIGTTLTAYYKAAAGSWTQLTTRTDSTYTSAGLLGMEAQDATTRYDNFGGGPVAAGGAGSMLLMGVGA